MIEQLVASACQALSGATVDWRCEPHEDHQRIYFGNHTSHLDFVVIWAALPAHVRLHVRPVAGHDYWSQGILRRYLAADVFRAVLIERAHGGASNGEAAARASIERIAIDMGDRDSIIVFPEGTRSLDGTLGPFKSGLYHLSQAKPDAELIPVHLDNLNRILPKGESLPVPMLSRVTFGKPLRSAVNEPKEHFLARARSAVLRLAPRN